jgi:hypothetical protein
MKLAYFAGLIDGEGCIGIYSRGKAQSRSPYLDVKMTCEKTVRSLHEFFGVGSVGFRKSLMVNRKDQWAWKITGKKAQVIIRQIQPFMLTKAEIAEEVLKFEVGTQGKTTGQ